ncbi:hypothetical protein EMIHUDRAFT_454999 [Emiliania huxleyi CCMP1516]|uniref:Serine/threonine-protein phosphatase 4 regulatory subunit 3-like central domain-containing protein n=2 Tax=Emiliania huxleyi TaxID=2903 RepID=A0A0D3KMS6_EMIH1|nr:hypothetical protein EMIHUDRAFT_454999 [Emiliania huxleyi CCMP1516]EOD37061.1 hypothetical protein EMIHUDRAFT_454999 [Emiliania huxleyi CCMP1516]|eukprot:XP_005789490.1 hypothetical protein EMIHUDRAFT_454999 [Emiliania huxleyi CCMP1516]
MRAEVLVNTSGTGWSVRGTGRVMWQQVDERQQRLVVAPPLSSPADCHASSLAAVTLPDAAIRFSLPVDTVLHALPIDGDEWAMHFDTAEEASGVWEDIVMLQAAAGVVTTAAGSASGAAVPAPLPDPASEGGLCELERLLGSLLYSDNYSPPEEPPGGSLLSALGIVAESAGGEADDYIASIASAFAAAEASSGEPPAAFGRAPALRRLMKDDGASFVFGALEHETRALLHVETDAANTAFRARLASPAWPPCPLAWEDEEGLALVQALRRMQLLQDSVLPLLPRLAEHGAAPAPPLPSPLARSGGRRDPLPAQASPTSLVRELTALASGLHPIERARVYRRLTSLGLLAAARSTLGAASAPAGAHVRCCDVLSAVCSHDPSLLRSDEVAQLKAGPPEAGLPPAPEQAAAASQADASHLPDASGGTAAPPPPAAAASTSQLLAARLCDTADEGVARQAAELLGALLDPSSMEEAEVLLELLASLLGAHGERGLFVATSPQLWRSLSGLLEQPGRVLRCSVARFEGSREVGVLGVAPLVGRLVCLVAADRGGGGGVRDSLANSAVLSLLDSLLAASSEPGARHSALLSHLASDQRSELESLAAEAIAPADALLRAHVPPPSLLGARGGAAGREP